MKCRRYAVPVNSRLCQQLTPCDGHRPPRAAQARWQAARACLRGKAWASGPPAAPRSAPLGHLSRSPESPSRGVGCQAPCALPPPLPEAGCRRPPGLWAPRPWPPPGTGPLAEAPGRSLLRGGGGGRGSADGPRGPRSAHPLCSPRRGGRLPVLGTGPCSSGGHREGPGNSLAPGDPPRAPEAGFHLKGRLSNDQEKLAARQPSPQGRAWPLGAGAQLPGTAWPRLPAGAHGAERL